jgi:hypothetical protein
LKTLSFFIQASFQVQWHNRTFVIKPIVFSQLEHQAHGIHDTDIRTGQQYASPPRTDPFDAKKKKTRIQQSAQQNPHDSSPLQSHNSTIKLCRTFPPPSPTTPPKIIAAHLTSQP